MTSAPTAPLRRLRGDAQRALRPLVHTLSGRVSPDAVTAASAAVSAAGGLALATGAPLGVLPVACGLRLVLDVLDGEVARASQRTTAFGGVLGDLNDGVGDALLYGGLAWGLAATQSKLALTTIAFLVLGLLGELAGVAAAAHGAPRGHAGPLGKVERMLGLSLVVLLPVPAVAAWGLPLLALATLVRRVGIARRQLAHAGLSAGPVPAAAPTLETAP